MSNTSKTTIWDEFKALVNMQPQEIADFLKTEESISVGADSGDGESIGHKSGKKIVKIKRTNKVDLTDADYDHMAEVVGYIKRHCSQGGPDDDVKTSAWRYSLMNWGHDPMADDGCAN